jgi:hypothetical protein
MLESAYIVEMYYSKFWCDNRLDTEGTLSKTFPVVIYIPRKLTAQPPCPQ